MHGNPILFFASSQTFTIYLSAGIRNSPPKKAIVYPMRRKRKIAKAELNSVPTRLKDSIQRAAEKIRRKGTGRFLTNSGLLRSRLTL